MEDWRRYYNEERPSGAIGNKAPISLMNSGNATRRLLNEAGKTLVSGGPKIGAVQKTAEALIAAG